MKDLKINLTGKRPQRGCGHPHNRGPIYWAPGMGEKQGPCWTPGRGVLMGPRQALGCLAAGLRQAETHGEGCSPG